MDVREKLVELPVEDAIRILRERMRHESCGYDDYLAYGGKGDPAEEAYLDALSMATNALAHGVTVQEWISTDERMPTEDDATDGYVAVVYDCGDGVKTKTISLVHVVIAYPDLYDYWMPLNLPQPPKGE